LFGDEKIFTYDKFVDARGRVVVKDVIAIANKANKSEAEWKFYHGGYAHYTYIEHNGGYDALEGKIKDKLKN
jgi:hypothetical protein